MRMRLAVLHCTLLALACSTEPGETPANIAGTWVLTFPYLFVPSNGYQCTSLSGTVLQVVQDGDNLDAPYSQGVLACAANPFDSVEVFFAQGRILGTIDGDALDLTFEGAPGTFTGTVQRNSASGDIEYQDPSYGVIISGRWAAQRRTPSGALNLTFSTSSMNGLPLPPILFTLDGDTTIQVPANGSHPLTGLTGGRHGLRVTNGDARSCSIGGGPSGSMGGRNPNDQFIEIVEGVSPRTVAYIISCT